MEWLATEQPDYLHIQLHSNNHFPLAGLINLLDGIAKLENPPKLVITPHTVHSASFDLGLVKKQLANVDRILVHKQVDYDYLLSQGLHNITLFPHPFDVYPQRDKAELRHKLNLHSHPIVVTHGLISEHKGLVEMVDAIELLRKTYTQILWLAVDASNINNVTSSTTLAKVQARVSELQLENHVQLITDFLSADEVLVLIQTADVGICAYAERGESASAAIRKFLASGVPTIVTDIPMMHELGDEVIKIENNSPEVIAAGISRVLENKQLAETTAATALEKSTTQRWEVMGQRLLQVYSSL